MSKLLLKIITLFLFQSNCTIDFKSLAYLFASVVYWLVCWPLDPNVTGSKPGQGDGFLRAIKILSTPSSRMESKAGKSHVVRFYGM
jgi:hypothetical protein